MIRALVGLGRSIRSVVGGNRVWEQEGERLYQGR